LKFDEALETAMDVYNNERNYDENEKEFILKIKHPRKLKRIVETHLINYLMLADHIEMWYANHPELFVKGVG